MGTTRSTSRVGRGRGGALQPPTVTSGDHHGNVDRHGNAERDGSVVPSATDTPGPSPSQSPTVWRAHRSDGDGYRNGERHAPATATTTPAATESESPTETPTPEVTGRERHRRRRRRRRRGEPTSPDLRAGRDGHAVARTSATATVAATSTDRDHVADRRLDIDADGDPHDYSAQIAALGSPAANGAPCSTRDPVPASRQRGGRRARPAHRLRRTAFFDMSGVSCMAVPARALIDPSAPARLQPRHRTRWSGAGPAMAAAAARSPASSSWCATCPCCRHAVGCVLGADEAPRHDRRRRRLPRLRAEHDHGDRRASDRPVLRRRFPVRLGLLPRRLPARAERRLLRERLRRRRVQRPVRAAGHVSRNAGRGVSRQHHRLSEPVQAGGGGERRRFRRRLAGQQLAGHLHQRDGHLCAPLRPLRRGARQRAHGQFGGGGRTAVGRRRLFRVRLRRRLVRPGRNPRATLRRIRRRIGSEFR